MRVRTFCALACALTALGLVASRDEELASPVKLEAAGKPIDVDIGHAAPCVGDVDGDGLADLLVGQFGEGKLRIYRNVGTADSPRYAEPEWLMAEGVEGTVPSG